MTGLASLPWRTGRSLGRTVSFTASRDVDETGQQVLAHVLATRVPFASRYVTGACTGGDAFIGCWLYGHCPEAEHVVIVPADRSRVDYWWRGLPGVTVIEMPPGSTYRDRNLLLAAEGDAMFAFPAYPEDDPRSLRSGTWQAARMARKAGKLSMWQCVRPPYRGLAEADPRDLLRIGEAAP